MDTLIHEDILSKLYEEQLKIFENEDFIIDIFAKY